jgi:hypothetical protein
MTGAKLLQSSNLHNSHLEIFKSFDCTFFVRAFDITNHTWRFSRVLTARFLYGLSILLTRMFLESA